MMIRRKPSLLHYYLVNKYATNNETDRKEMADATSLPLSDIH